MQVRSLVWTLLPLWAAVGRALAQDAGGAPAEGAPTEAEAGVITTHEDDDDARDPVVHVLLVEAVAEYAAGRYAEAQALFRRASEREPSARTLRGLGMSSFELRQYVTAVRALEAALLETTRPLRDDQRAHVEALLERARGYVARLEVHVTPEDATLRIDGIDVELETYGSVLVEPGRHVLSVSADGYDGETIDLALEPGLTRTITLELADAVAPAPPSLPPRSGDALGWASLTLGVAAGVGAGVALTLGGLAATESAELDAACSAFVCPDSARARVARARDYSIVADAVGTASAVVGAAATAMLVAALATSEGGSPPATASAFCTSTECVVVVGGRL